MAAFFPRTIYNTEASFTPLFRLLDDFDSYSRQCGAGAGGSCQGKRQRLRRSAAGGARWQPSFDVRETADAYELYGELPGLDRDDVSIEFTEPQTLVVRGRVERAYTTGTVAAAAAPAAAVEEAPRQPEPEGSADAAPAPPRTTVADEDDASIQEENGFEVVADAATTTTTTAAAAAATATPEAEAAAAPVDGAKYWLRERSVGEFARSFSFPSRVEQDGVTAGFRDGILSIAVPKARKHEPIRIAIN